MHPAGRRAPAGRSGHGTGGKPVNTAEVVGLDNFRLGAITLAGMALGAVRAGWLTGSLTIKAVPPWQRRAPERRGLATTDTVAGGSPAGRTAATVPFEKDRSAA